MNASPFDTKAFACHNSGSIVIPVFFRTYERRDEVQVPNFDEERAHAAKRWQVQVQISLPQPEIPKALDLQPIPARLRVLRILLQLIDLFRFQLIELFRFE
jgi:hypothetical protein